MSSGGVAALLLLDSSHRTQCFLETPENVEHKKADYRADYRLQNRLQYIGHLTSLQLKQPSFEQCNA